MENYKISIIIPTFNIEYDLKRAINSLLRQSIGFENLEVIMVDDCSTDNTRKIILEYAKEYDNIKPIFLKENSGGAGKPRNIGVKQAVSEYIMFLDNDDEYADNACEIFYNKMKETNVNLIVGCHINNLFKHYQKPLEITEPPIFKEINILNNPDELYDPITNYAGAVWCKIFKKEFLLKNNIECLEKLPEDVYFMHQCYYLNPNVLFLTNLYLYNHYFYRTLGDTVTVTASFNFLKKTFIMFDVLKELSLNYDNTDKFFIRYSQLFFNLMINHIIMTNSKKKEKIYLMKMYFNRLGDSNPKIELSSFRIWYNLVKNERFEICFIYSQLIRFLVNLKSKIEDLKHIILDGH